MVCANSLETIALRRHRRPEIQIEHILIVCIGLSDPVGSGGLCGVAAIGENRHQDDFRGGVHCATFIDDGLGSRGNVFR